MKPIEYALLTPDTLKQHVLVCQHDPYGCILFIALLLCVADLIRAMHGK
jgi:hypothetical protein